MLSDGGFVAGGAFNASAIPASSYGTRMVWYPGKAAFRAGRVLDTVWDDVNIGDFSMAFGLDTLASGASSTAIGSSSVAQRNTSTAMGYGTKATASYATAMGLETIASGHTGTAMGFMTTAMGVASTAIGNSTVARGGEGLATGRSTLAHGDASATFGRDSGVTKHKARPFVTSVPPRRTFALRSASAKTSSTSACWTPTASHWPWRKRSRPARAS